MRRGVTCYYVSILLWPKQLNVYAFLLRRKTTFVYSVLRLLRTKILNESWRYQLGKKRPKLEISSDQASHLINILCQNRADKITFAIDPIWNSTASHISLRLITCVWQFCPQGIFMATLIGQSAATRFWVAKIGANQVWKVLRPVGHK